jgi:1,4-dihydroxy-2-naphthoate octaprenyltransferase
VSVKNWIQAARPATLTAAAAPVAVGTACAHAAGGIAWLPAIAALLGAFWIQIGTNFANDVFDAEKGADTSARLGPTRAVAAGLLTARQMYRGMIVAFALATLCGLYLVFHAGWPVVAIGVASVIAGIAYTGGPWPLGYHGLGDVFVMIFFGFVAVCGTAFVQVGHVPTLAWWLSVPVGALATAVLVVNNLRDRQTDVHAGKRTLAVRFGRAAAIGEYTLLVLAAYGVPALLAASGATAWLLLPLATLPIARILVGRVASTDGAALNPLLGATARLLLLHSILMTAGVIIGT